MEKLSEYQKKIANNEIVNVKKRIKYLQSEIDEENATQLKKDFLGQQIKQLNIVLEYLQNMLKQSKEK